MRCLLVDDNVAFLHAMRAMLERDGATVVGMASNGDDAETQVRTRRPDVVLVDVRLGYESGFDVAHRIEEQSVVGSRRHAIILVSTQPEDEIADRIAANPSYGFLDKTTVSVEKVRKAIAARLGRGREPA